MPVVNSLNNLGVKVHNHDRFVLWNAHLRTDFEGNFEEVLLQVGVSFCLFFEEIDEDLGNFGEAEFTGVWKIGVEIS